MSAYHRPVLLQEVLEGLNVKNVSDGVFFDGTCGGGNHSFAVLESNPNVRLIATDKDGEAIEESQKRLAPFAGRFQLFRTDYKNYADVLEQAGVQSLDGFLLDLGISSHQIDTEERGFAYTKPDAPLDMRMDTRQKRDAKEVVNTYSEETLRRLLWEYGEESYARSIASNIVKERAKQEIVTCGQLNAVIERSVPPKYRYAACARKTFQAIRIEVNEELGGLGECVEGLVKRLKKGGRGCVITFHSLEDRIVKQVFRDLCTGCTCPKNFPVCVCGRKEQGKLIGKQPITAGEEELRENSRSKSAKLRIIEKIT